MLSAPVGDNEPVAKRRKMDHPDASDKLDPVEKLLSFAELHHDILHALDQEQAVSDDECDDMPPSSTPTPSNISVNFTNMLQENLRHYYSNCKRGPLEVYNANSLFAVLNQPRIQEKPPAAAPPRHEVPFFKNVNFNPNPNPSAYTFDEYLAYDDDEPESTSESENDQPLPVTPEAAHPLPLPTNLKMCFHYRQFNNNLNLSSQTPSHDAQQDIMQILNKRSIISGRASEMVSTGNFLINDFFL